MFGVIKDLVVSLSQFPMKSVVMDIVVADIPPKFACFYLGLGPRKWEDFCRWILHKRPSMFSEENIEIVQRSRIGLHCE
jgi:hypothetical protein